jgi:tetratricopeptide (TPR) repeat protein
MVLRWIKVPTLFLLLILVLTSPLLRAQDSRFRGTVKDDEGNPIAKAKITLTLIDRNYVFDFRTDDKGKFYRRGIEPGQYMVKVEVEGYAPFEQQVYIQVGQEYKTDIVIAKSAADEQVKNLEAKKQFEAGIQAFQEGKLEEAIAAFEQVVALVPDFAEGYYNLGMARLRKGDPDSAVAMMQKAVELKPDLLKAYFGMGQAYIEKGEEEKAAEILQKAATLLPDDAKASLNLGALYFANNQDDLALDALLKARDLDPSLAQAYYQLGLVYTRKGEMEKSVENFDKFLELAPQAPEAETVRKLLEEIRKKRQ